MMEGRALRQQPGFACEECRRRKARCDRGRPKCGLCTETGTTCVIVDKRQQRGPKKGQLSAMRSQIATLQWQLEQHFESSPGDTVVLPKGPGREREAGASRTDSSEEYGVDQVSGPDEARLVLTFETSAAPAAATTATSTSSLTSTCASSECAAGADLVNWADCMDWQDLEGSIMPSDMTEITLLDHLDQLEAGPSMAATGYKVTGLMQADLDQLYFDRVHPVCPVVHRRRYFAWAGQESPTPARACLRSAMRTMAAAMSAQWSDLADQLCAETRQLLETHSQTPVSSKHEISLQLIQAWLLLAYAEFLRLGEHQTMLTVGRAFRLVQMARLYDVDALDDTPVSPMATDHTPDESFVDAEEKRRTFWLAFSFDRFLCLRSEYPLTLQEETVHTRLPAPEENYQNNQPIRMGFLREVLTEPAPNTLSPFAECVVLAALQGRCMTHRRAYVNDPGLKSYDFWTHQEWLASAVERRVQTLVPYSPADDDPMRLFAHMLAHSTVVFLSNTVQRASWHTLEQQLVMAAYARRASVAAMEIVRLAKAVPALSCFRAHPFLPDPLTCAANFLSAPSNPVVGRSESVEQLLRVLRDAQVINSLAREHFRSLKLTTSGSEDPSSEA